MLRLDFSRVIWVNECFVMPNYHKSGTLSSLGAYSVIVVQCTMFLEIRLYSGKIKLTNETSYTFQRYQGEN